MRAHGGIGEMAEWLKAPVLKTGMGASPSWVRIPLSPLSTTRHCLDPNHGITADRYGHLFPSADGGTELAAAEKALWR